MSSSEGQVQALPSAILDAMDGGLRRRLEKARWTGVSKGCSGATVRRIVCADGEVLFLKVAEGVLADEIDAETACLRWLRKKLPVPEVVGASRDAGRSWLLMTAIPGQDASQRCHEGEEAALMDRVAEGLLQVHGVSTDGCPFDRGLGVLIAQADEHTQCGRVDEDDFDEARAGRKAKDLLVELHADRPAHEGSVFCHGDFCMPNVVLDDGRLRGFLDWGRGGVSDPYRDLALAGRSISRNWGEDWAEYFFRAYGLAEPDGELLAYYRLLDEFF